SASAAMSSSVSVSPVRCQRPAPRSKSVVSTVTPIGSSAARRTRRPCGTTSLPMPSPSMTARRRVLAVVVVMGSSSTRCRTGSVDEVDGVDGPRIDGGAQLLGELAGDGLVEVEDHEGLGALGSADAGDLHAGDVDAGLAEDRAVLADQAGTVRVAQDQQVVAQR